MKVTLIFDRLSRGVELKKKKKNKTFAQAVFASVATRSGADLIKKLLRAPQDVLELRQLQEVLLQRLLVGVDFLQLVLQLLEGGLEEQSGEGSARARSNQQSYGTGGGGVTSMSIMSLGKGTSGFSPVSTIGMSAFLISFSTNPANQEVQTRELQTDDAAVKSHFGPG